MDELFYYVGYYTGIYGMSAGLLVGLLMGLVSCSFTLAVHWLFGK